MITTELKDQVLSYLIEKQQELFVSFDGEKLAIDFNTKATYILAIIEDLTQRGLLTNVAGGGYYTGCYLKMKIFDFYKSGGYQFEDHIIEGNIMKLKMEIEAMEANLGKPQFDKMMAMIMAVIGSFSLISGKTN